jgi:hypothetical protein
MVLGMNCFGAPGTEQKVSPATATKQLGVAEPMEKRVAVKQEASSGHAVGEAKKIGGDQAKLAGKEGKKKRGAPILTHHFPFQSRPGLL